MSRALRIGTRDSELALWQAQTVRDRLEAAGHRAELVPVKSTGDLVLDKPLYELGITGIFTKTLDVALLREDIDLAVHSMKDVPTALPEGICQAAVMERAIARDGELPVNFGTEGASTGSNRNRLPTPSRELGQEEEDLLVIHQVEQKSIKTGGLLQLSKTMRKKS